MHHIAHVAEGEAAERVVDQFRDVQLIQLHLALEHVVQVCLDVIQHQANVHQVALLRFLVERTDEVNQFREEHVLVL